MTTPHVEWQRDFVIKYSTIARMKNGLRKTYFYETECKHQKKTLREISCPLCHALFECCQKCCKDFSESDVEIKTYNDLICPDCIEQCHQCKIFISEENGSRNDEYPYDLYCTPCANKMGYGYDSPDELEQLKPSQKELNEQGGLEDEGSTDEESSDRSSEDNNSEDSSEDDN